MTTQDPRGGLRLRHVELAVAAALLAAFLVFAVVHLADVHRDLVISALRNRTRRSFHLHRHPGLEHLLQVTADLGAVRVVLPIGAVVALGLLATRRWVRAAVVFAVGYAASYAVAIGKLTIRHPVDAHSFGMPIGSFPSGHTADVTAVLGVVLVVLLPVRWRGAAYAAAGVVGAFVAFTRVALGAHTRDDVAASWLLAMGLVVLAGWYLARRESA